MARVRRESLCNSGGTNNKRIRRVPLCNTRGTNNERIRKVCLSNSRGTTQDADLKIQKASRKGSKSMPYLGSYVFSRIAFYPSLFYNFFMSKISKREWYNRIDETVILGALPLRPITKKLVNIENVRGVISANLDHEVKHFTPTEEEWQRMGVDYLRLKIVDFIGTPSDEQISQALDFIDRHKQNGNSVYVHCKAGRTRSSTIVACYLIKANGWDDVTAWNHIVSCRSHARIFYMQREFLRQFYLSNKNIDDSQ